MEARTDPDATSPLTDEQVVARVLAGDKAIFEVIMRRHNGRIYRAARAILRDDAEAEDVMQEAYVRAYAHLSQFDGRARFSTWLTRIAVHEALARMRRRRRMEPMDPVLDLDDAALDPTAAADDPEARLSGEEIARLVEDAVDRLPEAFRTVFVLRAVEELSVAETAEVLDLEPDTVKTRLFRARARLQKDLYQRTRSAIPGVYTFLRPRCDRVVAAVLARIGADP